MELMEVEVDLPSILADAEQYVLDKYRVKIRLKYLYDVEEEWEEILHVIAKELKLNIRHYTARSRHVPYVFMRNIAAMILREKFKTLSLEAIGDRFGKHHTTISFGINSGNNLLETKHPVFTEMYLKAHSAVNKWLQEKHTTHE